jgi:hypothetical protein
VRRSLQSCTERILSTSLVGYPHDLGFSSTSCEGYVQKCDADDAPLLVPEMSLMATDTGHAWTARLALMKTETWIPSLGHYETASSFPVPWGHVRRHTLNLSLPCCDGSSPRGPFGQETQPRHRETLSTKPTILTTDEPFTRTFVSLPNCRRF